MMIFKNILLFLLKHDSSNADLLSCVLGVTDLCLLQPVVKSVSASGLGHLLAQGSNALDSLCQL